MLKCAQFLGQCTKVILVASTRQNMLKTKLLLAEIHLGVHDGTA